MNDSTGPKKTRVVIVEDHAMFREKLSLLINKEPDMEVCGESDNIQGAMEVIQSRGTDMAIVDITLKGSSGLELLKNLKALSIPLPVLVVSMHDESLYAERAIRAGAMGYITKYEAFDQVMQAIRRVMGGSIYLSETMTSGFLKRIAEGGPGLKGPSLSRLTDRELEVFQLIGKGKAAREIAETLNLGLSSIDTYRARIKEKLNLKNAAELLEAAAQWVKSQG